MFVFTQANSRKISVLLNFTAGGFECPWAKKWKLECAAVVLKSGEVGIASVPYTSMNVR